MLSDFIVEFSEYLNEQGYNVTPQKIYRLLRAFEDDDSLDCTDFDDILSLMKTHFCTSRQEISNIRALFIDYIKYKDSIIESKNSQKKIDDVNTAKSKLQKETQEKSGAISDEVSQLNTKIKNIQKDIEDNWIPEQAKYTKKERQFLESKKKWIDSLEDDTLNAVLRLEYRDAKEISDAEKRMTQRTKEALSSGKLSLVKDFKELFNILRKAEKMSINNQPKLDKAIKEATSDIREKIESLLNKKREMELQARRQQMELDQRIKEMQSKMVYKPMSIMHRAEFEKDSAKNFIQLVGHNEYPHEVDIRFDKLTENQKQAIMRYVYDNLLKFKTRMTRNLQNIQCGDVDMLSTIQNACKSGGLPMKIFKRQQRPGKANLILILDVSGSCKEASSLMLTFMYLLKEVFPRGCKVFAFVNSLYDITDIMSAPDVEQAITDTLSLIPRAGQYSNYERPITTMWEQYNSKITKDSIVMMIGDARNNKNASAENEFKNIVRRAKKTYWLNTDDIGKWNQGDSIASTYARYCPMYEVKTPRQLLDFIDVGLK